MGEPSSKANYNTWATANSSVREIFEIAVLSAAQVKCKNKWERTFCIMGQQVNVRCKPVRPLEKSMSKNELVL